MYTVNRGRNGPDVTPMTSYKHPSCHKSDEWKRHDKNMMLFLNLLFSFSVAQHCGVVLSFSCELIADPVLEARSPGEQSEQTMNFVKISLFLLESVCLCV